MTFVTKIPLTISGPAKVIVPDGAIVRLAGTCFRGQHKKLAGNFSRWGSVSELLSDPKVRSGLAKHIDTLARAQDGQGTFSSGITYPAPVGWASTAALGEFKPEDLESFRPNRRSTALRVRSERTDLLARQVSELTVVYQLKFESKHPTLIIHSFYPGKDVGMLCDDVSAREGVVFYDWNHPGA